MEARYTPKIGERGLFVFNDSVTVPSSHSYTVDSLSSARDLKLLGVDLTAEYTRNGVSKLDEDLKNNETLIKLVGVKGRFYLPLRVVKSFPSVDNYSYAQRIVGIDLGLVPTNEDLTTLLAKLAETVEKESGIQPKIKLAQQGGEQWLSSVDHDTAVSTRENRKEYSPTVGAKLQRTLDENAELKQRVALMEELLKGTKPPAPSTPT